MAPAAIVVGEHGNEETVAAAGAATEREAVLELPWSAAVTVTAVLAVTEAAVAVKVPLEAPAATVTEAGVVRAELLSVIVTLEPPVGAACESVTVQVEMAPDAIVVGEHWSAVTVTGAGPP